MPFRSATRHNPSQHRQEVCTLCSVEPRRWRRPYLPIAISHLLHHQATVCPVRCGVPHPIPGHPVAHWGPVSTGYHAVPTGCHALLLLLLLLLAIKATMAAASPAVAVIVPSSPASLPAAPATATMYRT